MWRETEEPRERWRGQAPAEGDKGTAGTRVRPALNSSPSPHLFETICNHQSGFSVFQKLDSWSGARTRVPQTGLSERTTRGEEEFQGCRERIKLASMEGSALGPRGRRVGISPFQEEERGGPARGRPPSACARVSSPAGRRAPPSGVE